MLSQKKETTQYKVRKRADGKEKEMKKKHNTSTIDPAILVYTYHIRVESYYYTTVSS